METVRRWVVWNAAMESAKSPGARAGGLTRYLPIAVIVLALAAFFLAGGHDHVSFETLRDHRLVLQDWVRTNTILAVAVYFATYVVVVACSLPGGSLLTLIGGFLFGLWFGGTVVVFAATIGACLLFLAARHAFGDLLRRKAGPTIQRMESGFRENAMSYLLVLRLVPLFPFFIVNLVPALLGVPLSTYVIATFFGIIPGTFVYASVGNGLGMVFEQGGEPDWGIIYNPEVFGPLGALALLSCAPIVYKRVKRRRLDKGGGPDS